MAPIDPITDRKELALLANTIRQDIVRMVYHAGSGHIGGALGMADIVATLYAHSLEHDPENPSWEKRDRLILSNGHICPVLYSAMARMGYFDPEELDTLRDFGTRLQGHPHREALPGLETTSGPLGSGLSQGVGMALAARMKKQNHHVVVLTSDGEHQEGNTWEAVMLAAKYRLDNLIQIIDRNYIQIEGGVEDGDPLDPIREKYEAFNWHVIEIDGHNIRQIKDAILQAKRFKNRPVLINAVNVPGKGVSFMEDNYKWHGRAPQQDEFEAAMKELEEIRTDIVKDQYDY